MTVSKKVEENIFASKLGPEYVGFDHITWYVGNAKQAASYYVTRMGFKQIAYRGPETGSRSVVSHVISNGQAIFVLTSPIRSMAGTGAYDDDPDVTKADRRLLEEIHNHLIKHGDGVKDVAFRIEGDIEAVWKRAVDHGAAPVAAPTTDQSSRLLRPLSTRL